MYKLDIPIDLKESNGIEQRRNREEQRKSRIFNSKIRQIGIDKNALNQQIEEKKRLELLQKEREVLYDNATIRADKIAILFEKRQNEDIRELNRTLNDFRLLYQKAEQRREFDLYDPNSLKKDKPARVCDDDPRCGVSSIQKFNGEDLNKKYRANAQKNQTKVWLETQINERQNMINVQKQSKRLYDLKQIELDKRACDLINAEEECKKAINVALSNYNEALMQEKNIKERIKVQQEEDDKKVHIINAIMSDLLTENPNQSISAFGAHRIIPDRYKGMSKEQLQQIYDLQQQQIVEKRRKEEEERKLNEHFDKQRIAQARTGLLIENEILRNKNALEKKFADENIKLSKNHQETIEYINKEIYTNQPTAEYFLQFNTCSR